jgi:cytoskeletal protein CcmA (bactofilin family)
MVVHLIEICQVGAADWRTIGWTISSNGGGMADERRRAAWIGGSVIVKGEVTSTMDLVIDGQVEGKIEIGDHNLTIGPDAEVTADLVAKSVTISGKVKGDVLSAGKVELKSSASVEGDITAPKLVMEDGAGLSGKVDTGTR